jgi:hypothetical protein
MTGQIIVALYDDSAGGERAVGALEEGGVRREELRLLFADNAGAAGDLIDSLIRLGIPEEEAQAYAEGVHRGGALVTARVPAGQAQRAADIIEQTVAPADAERTQARAADARPPSEAEAELRGGIIRRESETARMTGGPLLSAMSGMAGSPEGAGRPLVRSYDGKDDGPSDPRVGRK